MSFVDKLKTKIKNFANNLHNKIKDLGDYCDKNKLEHSVFFALTWILFIVYDLFTKAEPFSTYHIYVYSAILLFDSYIIYKELKIRKNAKNKIDKT